MRLVCKVSAVWQTVLQPWQRFVGTEAGPGGAAVSAWTSLNQGKSVVVQIQHFGRFRVAGADFAP